MLHFPSHYYRRLTWLYFGLLVTVGMTTGLLGPALPYLAAASGSTVSQIALLFTARAIGSITGALVTGLLMDRFNGHRVLFGMGVVAALSLAIAPLSPLLALMAAIFLVVGFAEVSLNVGGNTLLLWLHLDAAGPNVSALHFCFGLGNMLTPLLMVAAIAVTGQFYWAFWVVGICLISVLWPLLRFASPVKITVINSDQDNNRPSKYQNPVLLSLFLLLFSLYVGIEITFAGWITAYGVLSGLAIDQAALLATLFWLSLSIGRLLAIPLLSVCSHWLLLGGCLALGVIASAALYFLWLPLNVGALLFGLAISAFFPTLFTLCNQVMEMRGRTTGAIFTAAGCGALIIPSLTGPLLDTAGAYAFPILLVGLLLLVGLGLLALALWLRHLANL